MSAEHSVIGASPRPAMWRGFARGVRDNLMAELLVQGLRIGAIVLLARALEPRDFGLFRVLLIISMVVSLLNEAGIPDALIQRSALSRAHEATAWWTSLGLSLLCCALLYLLAPEAARLMAMPELKWGIRLLCLPQFLEGTIVTANARLQRRLAFGRLAVAEVVAEVAFLVTALQMLHAGMLRVCLPAALAARLAAHGLTVWLIGGLPTFERPRLAAAGELAGFATSVLGGRIVYLLSNNADYLLVGRLLGSTALGFYSIAWDLLRFIPDRLYKVAGRVALPAFCQLQQEPRELARAYLQFFEYIARLVLPLVACVAVAAPELLSTIYGAKWLPAALPLRMLAAGLMLAGLTIGIGPVYYTKGRPELDLLLHGLRLGLVVTVCVVCARWGLTAVSGAMGVVEGTVAITGCWVAANLLAIRPLSVLKAAAPGARLCLMCAGAMAVSKGFALGWGVGAPLTLALLVLAPAALFGWLEAGRAAAMVAAAFRSRQADAGHA